MLGGKHFDYLLGKEAKPKYYTDMADYVSGTQKIIDFGEIDG